MSLFDGVQSFTPAFTGQQLALQAGQGLAQAYTSGRNAGTGAKSQGLQQDQFDFQKKKFDIQTSQLDELARQLQKLMGGGGNGGDWAGETASPNMWQ